MRGLGDVRVRRVVLDAGLEAPRRPRQQAVLEAQQAAVQRDRGAGENLRQLRNLTDQGLLRIASTFLVPRIRRESSSWNSTR